MRTDRLCGLRSEGGTKRFTVVLAAPEFDARQRYRATRHASARRRIGTAAVIVLDPPFGTTAPCGSADVGVRCATALARPGESFADRRRSRGRGGSHRPSTPP